MHKWVNPRYRNAVFFLTDHDNSRPRVVNTWALLEHVLTAHLIGVIIDNIPQYLVRLWDPEAGRMRRLSLERADGSRDTWQLSLSNDTCVGELELKL